MCQVLGREENQTVPQALPSSRDSRQDPWEVMEALRGYHNTKEDHPHQERRKQREEVTWGDLAPQQEGPALAVTRR